MTAMRGPRLQVGSAAWVDEERSSALQIVDQEVEEFCYSARNEFEWLNEHMAGIFDENEVNIAETFKTPGKLRGKTPRTARKNNPTESREPLSDLFAPTPNASKGIVATQIHRFNATNLHTIAARTSPLVARNTSPKRAVSPTKQLPVVPAPQDSGYYGSQDIIALDSQEVEPESSPHRLGHVSLPVPSTSPSRTSPIRSESPEKSFETANDEHTNPLTTDEAPHSPVDERAAEDAEEVSDVEDDRVEKEAPSEAASQQISSPSKSPVEEPADEDSDDARSPSEASSPIRFRKSSLNFASLPAREPLTAGKSIGSRLSRSHLDNAGNRTSYYQRPTGGKSLGNVIKRDSMSGENNDMEVDHEERSSPVQTAPESPKYALNHTKTYTQRLQDQISMLGKSQGSNAQKSNTNASVAYPNLSTMQQSTTPKSSPKRDLTTTTPGAFPEEEDDDDWIEPPKDAEEAVNSRPKLSKSYTTDIMEGINDGETIGHPEFSPHKSDDSPPAKVPLGKAFPGVFGHGKSASVAAIPTNASAFGTDSLPPLTKTTSIPNAGIFAVSDSNGLDTPSKSPSRSLRDSPLKQVKNKLSSILKSSKGLLASSAALSAEGKSMLSPSPSRLGLHLAPSTESVIRRPELAVYETEAPTEREPESPVKPVARRTRASTEREKEEKRREKEAKRQEEQLDKLEQVREKEREKARVFSKEQEKIIAMEKEIASKKEERPVVKDTPVPLPTSPKKAKLSEENAPPPIEKDVEMADMPPPPVPSSAVKPSAPAQAGRAKDSKRPVKPTKDAISKTRQAPTVIRVNMGSQHSQIPSSRVSTASHETAGSNSSQTQNPFSSKASKVTLQTKSQAQSMKGLPSGGRSKGLEMATKKKEPGKVEMEKKRITALEEQRKQEQQRRLEVEKQAEERKNASRQAAIEKAKQTRAPPPAARSQTNVATGESQALRPLSRMGSNMFRDESSRPVNTALSTASKPGTKRAFGADQSDDAQHKRPPSRGGPSYQTKDAKRRRTSEFFDDELEMGTPPNIKGPPVRPSAAFKKDLPGKSTFQNGYTNVPQSATRDLFKATVTAQHNSHVKVSHPLDMAQISKGPIPFAPTAGGAGSSYKTPARPGAFNGAKSTAKPATRSSPRFQNGDSIELPEIETDDDDDDDDEGAGMAVASWADSPDLRRALMAQETMDPSQIFGPPAPLNMEEVFNKSKDKWHKFRQRTSSANWSGLDRLTEEDIRKDMAARDKMRRDGGWSYEMSKQML